MNDTNRNTLEGAGYRVLPTCHDCARSGAPAHGFCGFCQHLDIEVRGSGQCNHFELRGANNDDVSEAAHGDHAQFYSDATMQHRWLREVFGGKLPTAEEAGPSCSDMLRKQTDKLVANLTDREREVMRMRFPNSARSSSMRLGHAIEIVQKCSAHSFFKAGVIEEVPSLEEYSLSDLIDANHIIAERNHCDPGTESESRKIQVMCDDRLVAALFALYSYEPDPQSAITPIAVAPGRALCCVVYENAAAYEGPVARLDPDSDRAATWLEIYGSLEIPILDPSPVPATYSGSLALYYRADLERIDEASIEKAIRCITARFGISTDEAREGVFGEEGIPILADGDITVVVDGDVQ